MQHLAAPSPQNSMEIVGPRSTSPQTLRNDDASGTSAHGHFEVEPRGNRRKLETRDHRSEAKSSGVMKCIDEVIFFLWLDDTLFVHVPVV